MEIDRIHQVQRLLKVERTGSESERRKHQRPDEEFTELLEHSMKDGNGGEQHGEPGQDANGGGGSHLPAAATPPPVAADLIRDTVSLSTSAPVVPAVTTDIVSISTAALVSSESLKAQNGALRVSLVQRTAQELRNLALAQHGNTTEEETQPPKPPPPAPPPPVPGSLDTVA
jgi:hypothetical protein